MENILPWAALAVVVVIALVALRWELYVYEGMHLGPRVQGWLYDQWAARYDADKRTLQSRDFENLTGPLLAALASAAPAEILPEPLVLDIATGTARLPIALLGTPAFTGRVVGLDLSRGMLTSAAAKLAAYGERIVLVWHTAMKLPFPAGTFDAVACLEALELMPNMHEPLAEMARVLRPGGILLVSRGGSGLGWKDRVRTPEEFQALVLAAGFVDVSILPWQKGEYEFDQVWARKPGQLAAAGARGLTDVLACPRCGAAALVAEPGRLRCRQCLATAPIDSDGIALLEAT